MTITSASTHAAVNSAVARKFSLSVIPGKYRGFSWLAAIAAINSGSRPHITTSAFSQQRSANAVPHEPAPITASRVTAALRERP